MRVSVRKPAAGAGRIPTDHRTTVTFTHNGLPLPLRFHFVGVYTVETGERELRHVGVSIGDEALDEESALALPELPPTMLRRVVERYPHWLELARAHATVYVDVDGSLADTARAAKRVKPARLDEDWYRMIAAEYRHHTEQREPAPVTLIARSHGVSPSASSRWVTAARKLGFLEEEN